MSERIPAFTKALLTLSLFFACATLGAGLALFIGWPVAILSGMVGFISLQQVLAGFARRRDKRAIAREMAHLRKGHMDFESALSDTHMRLDELGGLIEQRASSQERKIVAELKVLETLMRDFAGKISRSAAAVPREGAARSQRGPAGAYLHTLSDTASPRGELLETIRASLEQNRVDLYLQPIVSLPQRKLRYYEALSRLRDSEGQIIMPDQYMQVAGRAGLMSVVDNLLLFRCVQIVRRLTQKNRDIGIFCNISGETLADKEFFPQFLEYMRVNRDLAGQIIFEFSQQAVRDAGIEGEKNLAALATIGVALSMDHVESLAIDFLRLKAIGFRYLKVRSDTLMRGMNGAGAAIAAEDFKKLLTRHGLNLIAEHVEDEKTVVQLLDYAVDYAQGYLFGEPRAVREDSLKPVSALEAAPVIPFKRAG
ncbi:MAG: EAL domain-containing protein [Alphaproteobacteria bacterium]|nr:EAL domain-containing protein [Alphaproteobacteria bacterium]